MKRKVLTGTSSFAGYDASPIERLRQANFETISNPFGRKLTKEEVLELIPGVTGIIAGLEPLDADVLRQSQLKVISRVGAGLSNVDLKVAEELGIKVCSTPDAPTTAVAELTIAGMLNCLRQIPVMDQDMHQGTWNRRNGYQLEGKTVLIVGFGRIGRRVAELLSPFHVKILIFDPYIIGKSGEDTLPLDEALPQADIITFHCSGEECLLNKESFLLLKEGVIICNAARGGLIEEQALVAAIESGQVRSCWLDTFEQEPYGGILTTLPQAILTPHVGSFTRECRVKMEMQAVENLIQALKEDAR